MRQCADFGRHDQRGNRPWYLPLSTPIDSAYTRSNLACRCENGTEAACFGRFVIFGLYCAAGHFGQSAGVSVAATKGCRCSARTDPANGISPPLDALGAGVRHRAVHGICRIYTKFSELRIAGVCGGIGIRDTSDCSNSPAFCDVVCPGAACAKKIEFGAVQAITFHSGGASISGVSGGVCGGGRGRLDRRCGAMRVAVPGRPRPHLRRGCPAPNRSRRRPSSGRRTGRRDAVHFSGVSHSDVCGVVLRVIVGSRVRDRIRQRRACRGGQRVAGTCRWSGLPW